MFGWLSRALAQPRFSAGSEECHRTRVLFAHLLSMLAAAALIALFPLISGGPERRLVVAGLLAAAALTAWILLRLGRPRLASLVALFDVFALLFGLSLFAGGVRAPAYGGLLLVSTAAAVLVGGTAALIASVLAIVAGLALLVLEQSHLLPPSAVVHTPETIWGANALFLALATVPLAVASRQITRAFADLRAEVAERRLVEEELREERSFANTVLDTVSTLVVVLDTSGRIVRFNKACESLTGYTEAEARGRVYWEFLAPPELVGELSRGFLQLKAGDFPYSRVNAWITRTGETRLIAWSNNAVVGEDGGIRYVIGTGQDITELDALSHVKDQFLSVAAHELKTPVAIMKGYAQTLMRSDAELDHSRRRLLTAIDRGADRIDAIVKDLLDISRLQVGQLELQTERLCLRELAAEVAGSFSLTAPKHRILVGAGRAAAVVRGDRYRLEQVLANLIDNAVRYSPAGGEIEITIESGASQATVSIHDEGVGIAADKQAGVFERFYRAHTGTPYDYGGMGVGLYIAREIVERHQGRMWFESAEGKGSTFYFSLPLAN